MDHSLGKRKYATGGAGDSSPKLKCVRAQFDFGIVRGPFLLSVRLLILTEVVQYFTFCSVGKS